VVRTVDDADSREGSLSILHLAGLPGWGAGGIRPPTPPGVAATPR
jgi:hypothetical protein